MGEKRCQCSGVFELPLGVGVHGFQDHDAGGTGGGHGAAVVGKQGRELAASQIAGLGCTHLLDAPVRAPPLGRVRQRIARQLVTPKKNDQRVLGSMTRHKDTAASARRRPRAATGQAK